MFLCKTDVGIRCYKYLGVSLNNMLEWSTNKEVVYRKGRSRLDFFRRLRFFTVCSCSECFISVSWTVSAIKVKDVNRLNKRLGKAGSVDGCQWVCLEELVEQKMLTTLQAITDNAPHPLHKTGRLLCPLCSKERDRRLFLTSTIRLFYASTRLSGLD